MADGLRRCGLARAIFGRMCKVMGPGCLSAKRDASRHCEERERRVAEAISACAERSRRSPMTWRPCHHSGDPQPSSVDAPPFLSATRPAGRKIGARCSHSAERVGMRHPLTGSTGFFIPRSSVSRRVNVSSSLLGSTSTTMVSPDLNVPRNRFRESGVSTRRCTVRRNGRAP